MTGKCVSKTVGQPISLRNNKSVKQSVSHSVIRTSGSVKLVGSLERIPLIKAVGLWQPTDSLEEVGSLRPNG